MFYKLACLGKVILINGSFWSDLDSKLYFCAPIACYSFFSSQFDCSMVIVVVAVSRFYHLLFQFYLLSSRSIISSFSSECVRIVILLSLYLYRSPNFSRTHCVLCTSNMRAIFEHSFMLISFSYQNVHTRIISPICSFCFAKRT